MDVEVSDMKIATLFALILLVGCVVRPTTDELQTRAFLSGDWSAVEKREQAILRRESRNGFQCPANYVGYCENRFGDMRCSCVNRSTIRMLLYGQ